MSAQAGALVDGFNRGQQLKRGRMPHKKIGLILNAEDMSYATMTKVGTVTIQLDKDEKGVFITVEGFEFSDPPTCRMHGVRGLLWAKDILEAQIEAIKLIPGGQVITAVG